MLLPGLLIVFFLSGSSHSSSKALGLIFSKLYLEVGCNYMVRPVEFWVSVLLNPKVVKVNPYFLVCLFKF